jgi:hypothetical protein
MISNRRYRAVMDAAATSEEISAVQGLLDELNLGIQAQSDHTERGAIETLPWTLTIVVPATTFLTAFTKKLGERSADVAADAVDTAAKVLRRWIFRIHESRRGQQGVLIVTDRDRGLDIVLPRDLSLEACRRLSRLLETLPNQGTGRPSELRWTGVSWVQHPL